MDNKSKDQVIDFLYIGVVVAVCVNLFSSWLQAKMEKLLEPYLPSYPNIYLYIVIGFGILVSTIYLLYKLTKTQPQKELVWAQEIRTELLASLEKRYKDRFKKKLQNDIKLNMELELSYTVEGTDTLYVQKAFQEEYQEGLTGNFQALLNVFEEKLLRLLIIGEPGSGKSTILLQFAMGLIKNAKQNQSYPLPIILNLSSWRNDCHSFEEWLEQNLVFFAGEFGTSKQNAKRLSKEGRLLLLLDGLDEVPFVHQASCLQKLEEHLQTINQNKEDNLPEVIICCRTEDYKLIDANAPVQATAKIELLSLQKTTAVMDSLTKSNSVKAGAARKLQSVISAYPNLLLYMNTAFYMQVALSLASKNFNFSSINSQHDLLLEYINVESYKIEPIYSRKRFLVILKWLSNKMSVNRMGVSFELSDLQPNWAKNKWLYLILNMIVIELVYYAFTSIISAILPHYSYTLNFTIQFQILIPIIVLIFHSDFKIEVEGINKFSFTELDKKKLIKALLVFLVGGPAILTLVYLITYLVTRSIPTGLILYLSLYFFFYLIIASGTKEIRYPVLTNSYQRFYSGTIYNLVTQYISFFLSCTVLYYVNINFNFTHFLIMSFQLGTFITLIISSLVGFSSLQLLLYIEKSTPLLFAKFLNIAADRTTIIEKDGGQWRFRHKLIQDELMNINIV